MARVSFLMSLYNGETYLAESLKTLLAQDYDDYDILIIDDGSTDDWQNVVDKFDQKRIRVHSHSNRGLVESLNVGLKMLDCEFMARADDDDVYFSNRLSTQIEYMDFANLDAISCRVLNIDGQGHHTGLGMQADEMWRQDPQYFPAREPYLSHPFLTVRLDVMNDIGGYRHAHLCEDADLYWRLFRKHKMVVHEEPLGKYRIHSGSVSSNAVNRGRVQAFYSQLAALNEQRFRQNLQEIPYLPSIKDEIERATSLNVLLEPYRKYISNDEMTWLLAAASAKLVDLGGWRNYILSDVDFDEAINHFAKANIDDYENRERLREQLVRARTREAHKAWDGVIKEPSMAEKLLSKRPLR